MAPPPQVIEGNQNSRLEFSGRSHAAAGRLVFVVFALLAAFTAFANHPWINEGWFAEPALNFLLRGSYSTPTVDGTGTWLEGCDRYMYWFMPLHSLVQMAWYKLTGFNLYWLRTVSIWSALALSVCWHRTVLLLFRDRTLAISAIGLLLLDPRFIRFAALGRMDMLCAACGYGALLAYLALRRHSVERAILWSSALCAVSVMTHPCGVLHAVGVGLLFLVLDRRTFRIRLVGIAAIPFAVAFAAWGVYISKAPAIFYRQFTGNVSGFAGEIQSSRGMTFWNPWLAFKQEIAQRYLYNFGYHSDSPWQLLVLAFYALCILEAIATRRFRSGPYRLIGMLGLLFGALLFLLDGLHEFPYIVHELPLVTLIAAWTLRAVSIARPKLALAATAALIVLQAGTSAREIVRDTYHSAYAPVTAYLRQQWTATASVIGPAELCFSLGFGGRIHDDVRLGYFTGRKPEFIVTDSLYDDWHRAARRDPSLARHIENTLANYAVVLRSGQWTVYRARSSASLTVN